MTLALPTPDRTPPRCHLVLWLDRHRVVRHDWYRAATTSESALQQLVGHLGACGVAIRVQGYVFLDDA